MNLENQQSFIYATAYMDIRTASVMEMVGNDNGKLRTNRTTHRKMDEIKELLNRIVELLEK